MDQEKLHDALKKMVSLADRARTSGYIATEGDVNITYDRGWRGIDHCPWPGCEKGEARQASWEVSRNDISVRIWEMMFHYAQVNHWISFTDISEEDQSKLIKIFE